MSDKIHSYLVHPGKHQDSPTAVAGTEVTGATGSLIRMLTNVFDKSVNECDIGIVFRPDESGQRKNPCRDLVVDYARAPTLPKGHKVAERLQSATTRVPGLGLLFLMRGKQGDLHRVVVARFPADQGVIAEEATGQLQVEFVERIFMKSSKAYKSALYSGTSFDRGFWEGRAVDHQASEKRELANYWIGDFLHSTLKTTGAAGTKRLATAMRAATRSADSLAVREQLIAASTLLRGRDGQTISTRSVIDQLGLSDDARVQLEGQCARNELMNETFTFDREEYDLHARFRSVELDNGGVMIAEDDKFEDVFKTEALDDAGRRRYVTEGRVVDQELRKSK